MINVGVKCNKNVKFEDTKLKKQTLTTKLSFHKFRTNCLHYLDIGHLPSLFPSDLKYGDCKTSKVTMVMYGRANQM